MCDDNGCGSDSCGGVRCMVQLPSNLHHHYTNTLSRFLVSSSLLHMPNYSLENDNYGVLLLFSLFFSSLVILTLHLLLVV